MFLVNLAVRTLSRQQVGSLVHHAKRLAECKVRDDVKRQIVEPQQHIDSTVAPDGIAKAGTVTDSIETLYVATK